MIWGVTSPTLQQDMREDHVLLLGGCPPSPLLVRCPPPPIPLLQALREEHVLLIGGVPPLLRLLAALWGSVLPGRGVTLSPLAKHSECALLGAPLPPSSTPWMRAGGALPCREVLLPPLAMHW